MRGGSLTDFGKPAQAADPDILLYVEGEGDCEILFKRWIKRDTRLNRAFPRAEGTASGGCQQVIERVRAEVENGDCVVMGLVDGDYLVKKKGMDVFREQEISSFSREAQRMAFEDQRLHGRVWILPRWEIENYLLLDVELILDHIKDSPNKHGGPSTPKDCRDRLEHLARVLQPYLVAMVWCFETGGDHKTPKGAYVVESVEAMQEAVRACYPLLDEASVEAISARLAAAMGGETESWERRSRVLDGKWMLKRLANWSSSSWEEMGRHIARTMGWKLRGPPDEVRAVLDLMIKEAKQISLQGRQGASARPTG